MHKTPGPPFCVGHKRTEQLEDTRVVYKSNCVDCAKAHWAPWATNVVLVSGLFEPRTAPRTCGSVRVDLQVLEQVDERQRRCAHARREARLRELHVVRVHDLHSLLLACSSRDTSVNPRDSRSRTCHVAVRHSPHTHPATHFACCRTQLKIQKGIKTPTEHRNANRVSRNSMGHLALSLHWVSCELKGTKQDINYVLMTKLIFAGKAVHFHLART